MLKPPHAQRQSRRARLVDQESVFIRAAMRQRRRHRAHAHLRLFEAVYERDPANPTHALT